MNLHRVTCSSLVPAAIIAALGCDQGRLQPGGSIERDSAGVTIVENAPPYPKWQLAASPELRIGVVEGDAAYQLHNVLYAARMTDGRVVLVDGGTLEVRWYDASGVHRSTTGGRGEGPGEFRYIASATLAPGDTLIVYDGRSRRVTWLAPDERMAREFPVDGTGRFPTRVLVAGDSVVMAEQRQSVNIGGDEFNYTRDTLVLTQHTPEKVATIAELPSGEAVTWVRYEGGRPANMMRMSLPFGYSTLVAAQGDMVVVASDERRSVGLVGAGRVSRVYRRSDADARPVADIERQRYADYTAQRVRASSPEDVPEALRSARERMALLAEDHTMPVFDRLLIDSGYRIWVRDYVPPWQADEPATWTVYAQGGRVAGRITVPARLEVMHVGLDHATGVERDEAGVEYVAVYRILTNGGP